MITKRQLATYKSQPRNATHTSQPPGSNSRLTTTTHNSQLTTHLDISPAVGQDISQMHGFQRKFLLIDIALQM